MDKEKTLRKLKQEIEEVQKKHGVDPLELVGVVRCRDCKYKQGATYRHGRCVCERNSRWVSDDCFCEQGERRDQDAEV